MKADNDEYDLGTIASELIFRVQEIEADRDELREMLEDVYRLRGEFEAVGAFPGFKERHAAAWKRIEEYFQP